VKDETRARTPQGLPSSARSWPEAAQCAARAEGIAVSALIGNDHGVTDWKLFVQE